MRDRRTVHCKDSGAEKSQLERDRLLAQLKDGDTVIIAERTAEGLKAARAKGHVGDLLRTKEEVHTLPLHERDREGSVKEAVLLGGPRRHGLVLHGMVALCECWL